jgi:biotin operon repressor
MNLQTRFQKLQHLCSLIRRKATGTPRQLAEKLDLSRGVLYKLIQELESFGAEMNSSN